MARKAEKIAQEARIAVEKWREGFKHNIDLYHEMHDFILGRQWTDDEEQEMIKTFKKTPLVSNKLATLANTLLGEQQQNTPQLQVVPLANCDEQTAHLRELVVKDITLSQKAKTVYQVAANQAAIGGYGAYMWDTEYSHNKSFDLDIVPRYFKDSTRTFFDLGAEDINKTDGQHAGYITRMTRSKFRDVFGEATEEKVMQSFKITQSKEEIALATEPNDQANTDPFTWADDDGITIIDYFKRVYEKDTLYKLSNGAVYNQEEMNELIEKSREINQRRAQAFASQMFGQMPGQMPEEGIEEVSENVDIPKDSIDVEEESVTGEYEGDEPPETEEVEGLEDADVMVLWDNDEQVRIEEKRDIKKHKIWHYKIAGDYLLEEGEFPSESLPIIFVDQNSYYDKNGKQICRSFFGDCKDTQRYINYLRTQSAFIIKVSRYDQWIGSKKNVASLDTQRKWRDPNAFQGMLTYDESPTGAKPEQIRPPELSASLFQQYQLAIEDLYTSTGLYPTRLGQQGNEVSGAAIDARTRQGSYPTYVFFNSINRAIAAGGVVVNEMIPRVFDSQRVIALMTPNEGLKNITLNEQTDEYAAHIKNDIRKGTFEVRLLPGPSFEGQKQMALDSLKEVLQADPQAFQLIADLYAENLPLANTIEIKNRLKTLVPPQIVNAGKTGKMPNESGQPSPQEQMMQAQMQQQMMQAQMQQQMMQAQMQQQQREQALKEKELELKRQEIIMDAQLKLRELENDRLESAAKLTETELRYAAETQRTENDRHIAHADNLTKILTQKF